MEMKSRSRKHVALNEITLMIIGLDNYTTYHSLTDGLENREGLTRREGQKETEPILKSFRSLKSKVSSEEDLSLCSFHLPTLFQPFLEVLTSPICSGPITGLSLQSIAKILNTPGDTFICDASTIQVAISNITLSVCNTVFEASSIEEDEVVLCGILQTLDAAVTSIGGHLLTDESIWEIFQTGWRTFSTSTHTVLLQSIAKDMLSRLVTNTFKRISCPSSIPSLEFTPWSLPVMMKMMGFLIATLSSSMSLTGQKNGRIRLLVLTLLKDILNEGGYNLLQCDGVRMLVQDDLCKVLIQLGSRGRYIPLIELSATLQVTQILILSFRSHLKLQVEAILKHIYLRTLIKPTGVIDPSTELIMEHLFNLLSDTTFLVDIYVNYDCSLSSADLMETLIIDLSKNVFPLKDKSLGSHNWLAFTALLNCLKFMLRHITENIKIGPSSPCLVNEEVEAINSRKALKILYKKCVTQFNEKPNEGIQSLLNLKLIQNPFLPKEVAYFFRYTPGLDKRKVGEYLGNIKDINQEVLTAFVDTFNFTGMHLLDSLRMFLETFRLPGEAQMIDRIMQTFSNAVMLQCLDAPLFATADVAYLLSFAIIMLNTDLHNPNIPEDKKMKVNDFIRLNKNYDAEISHGRNLSGDYLEGIYYSIKNYEIITSEGGGNSEFRSEMWHDLIVRLQGQDNSMIHVSSSISYFDKPIFEVIWQPMVTSLSLVYDNTTDSDQVEETLEGFLIAFRISNSLHLPSVFDSLIIALSNFTSLTQLKPSNYNTKTLISNSLRNFGLNHKAQMATITLFGLQRLLGASISITGWNSILHCFFSLHIMSLLPNNLTIQSEEDLLDPSYRLYLNELINQRGNSMSENDIEIQETSEGIFASFFNWNNNTSKGNESLAQKEMEKQIEISKDYSLQCVEACHLDSFISDSRLLEDESLSCLCTSIIYYMNQRRDDSDIIIIGEDSIENNDIEILCIKLIIEITLRNRDRIHVVFDSIRESLLNVIKRNTILCHAIAISLSGILRLCIRLMHKPSICDFLLNDINNILDYMSPSLLYPLLPIILAGERKLIELNVDYLIEKVWNITLKSIKLSVNNEYCSQYGFDLITLILNSFLSSVSLSEFTSIISLFIESKESKETRCITAIDYLVTLESYETNDINLIKNMEHTCRGLNVKSESVNLHCLLSLQRIIEKKASICSNQTYIHIFNTVLFPMIKHIREEKRTTKVYLQCIQLLCKIFLLAQCILVKDEVFIDIWNRLLIEIEYILHTYEEGNERKLVIETIHEVFKNIILVLVSSNEWNERECMGDMNDNLWTPTWKKIKIFSPSLYNDMIIVLKTHFSNI